MLTVLYFSVPQEDALASPFLELELFLGFLEARGLVVDLRAERDEKSWECMSVTEFVRGLAVLNDVVEIAKLTITCGGI